MVFQSHEQLGIVSGAAAFCRCVGMTTWLQAGLVKAIQRMPVKKTVLILLLASVCVAPVHAATPVENAGEPAASAPGQRQRDPTVGRDSAASTPSAPAQAGAINPANGQYYPPTGNGDVINPATGERYIGTPGGYINPSNGQFMPKIR
jgi:hypothetical protein